MTTITGEQIIGRVRKLASEHPNETRTCSYVKGNQPECIFGRALVDLGVPLDFLSKSGGSIFSLLSSINTYCSDIRIKSELVQEHWMSQVQRKQDMGHAWVIAVEAGDRFLRDRDIALPTSS